MVVLRGAGESDVGDFDVGDFDVGDFDVGDSNEPVEFDAAGCDASAV